MVWKQATDMCAGDATKYGAPDLVKVSQLFSDTDVTDTVTIHESVNWTFQADMCTGFALRMSNPAQTFNYIIISSAIAANRNVTLPLLTANGNFVIDSFANTFTAGAKQTFSQSGTTAGLSLGAVSGCPSCLSQGDVWYNTAGNVMKWRGAAGNFDFVGATKCQTLTNKTINGNCNTISNLAIGAEVSTAITETQEIWIGAEAMVSTTTNGAAFASRELATNDVMISSMAFDTTTSESAQFTWTPPANWNASTVRFKAYWTNQSGAACQTIDFDLSGRAYADNDAIDQVTGTAQNVTDTFLAQCDVHITAFSSNITIGGGPVAGEPIVFKLSRDVAADNLAGDAEIIGIVLEYTINDVGTT